MAAAWASRSGWPSHEGGAAAAGAGAARLAAALAPQTDADPTPRSHPAQQHNTRTGHGVCAVQGQRAPRRLHGRHVCRRGRPGQHDQRDDASGRGAALFFSCAFLSAPCLACRPRSPGAVAVGASWAPSRTPCLIVWTSQPSLFPPFLARSSSRTPSSLPRWTPSLPRASCWRATRVSGGQGRGGKGEWGDKRGWAQAAWRSRGAPHSRPLPCSRPPSLVHQSLSPHPPNRRGQDAGGQGHRGPGRRAVLPDGRLRVCRGHRRRECLHGRWACLIGRTSAGLVPAVLWLPWRPAAPR